MFFHYKGILNTTFKGESVVTDVLPDVHTTTAYIASYVHSN